MEITAESDALVVLSRLLSERLVVVDVGARWGFAQAWDRLRERCLTIGFEADDNQVVLLDRWGGTLELPRMTKIQVAHAILDRVLALRSTPKPRRAPSR